MDDDEIEKMRRFFFDGLPMLLPELDLTEERRWRIAGNMIAASLAARMPDGDVDGEAIVALGVFVQAMRAHKQERAQRD